MTPTDGVASDCIFCKIALREVSAAIVHSSDRVVAFRDINPKAPTHILLISREHVSSIADVTEQHSGMLAELFASAHHLAKAEGVDHSGWRLVTNVGPDAGQSVHHLHFHLLGGRAMGWPPG